MTADRLPMRVFDWDLLGDDAIGAIDFKVKRIVKDASSEEGIFEWR
jgi:hypothetical protein|tara:strand:+ start:208 stop:345 length:138 start_codon:yes stop_codon:yes gene_type:complete